MRPVKKLDRKTVYPNNLEKMNVARALLIFSHQVTAALEVMVTLCPENIKDINSLTETINFLCNFRKWFEIHDVCNTTHGIHSRNENKFIFSNVDDERLEWLQEDFLKYIQQIQSYGGNKAEKFTSETFEALLLTSRSTSECINLLQTGFIFVLSRNLSSDDIEQFFSHLRHKGGFNDAMDVRSCIYAIEATLQTGIIAGSSHGNVQLKSGDPFTSSKAGFLSLKPTEEQLAIPQLPPHVQALLEKPIIS